MGREPFRKPPVIVEQGANQGGAVIGRPVRLYVIVHGSLASLGAGSG